MKTNSTAVQLIMYSWTRQKRRKSAKKAQQRLARTGDATRCDGRSYLVVCPISRSPLCSLSSSARSAARCHVPWRHATVESALGPNYLVFDIRLHRSSQHQHNIHYMTVRQRGQERALLFHRLTVLRVCIDRSVIAIQDYETQKFINLLLTTTQRCKRDFGIGDGNEKRGFCCLVQDETETKIIRNFLQTETRQKLPKQRLETTSRAKLGDRDFMPAATTTTTTTDTTRYWRKSCCVNRDRMLSDLKILRYFGRLTRHNCYNSRNFIGNVASSFRVNHIALVTTTWRTRTTAVIRQGDSKSGRSDESAPSSCN